MEHALHPFISELSQARRVVVGYSGGLDSQVLLHLVSGWFTPAKILAVHVHHHLQRDADQWADFCRLQARKLGVSFERFDVYPDASEEAARQARFDVFDKLLEPGDVLLLAHHRGDQAETLLFRLCRGAGLNGLGGIAPRRQLKPGVPLLRPLLQVDKPALRQWAEFEGISWVDDPSNRSEHYARNYLRQTILPQLKKRWPKVEQQLADTASLMAESSQVMNLLLDEKLEQMVDSAGALSIVQLNEEDKQVQRALVRRWFWLGTGIGLEQGNLAILISQSMGSSQGRYEQGSWVVQQYRDSLYIYPSEQVPIDQVTLLQWEECILPAGSLSWVASDLGLDTSYFGTEKLELRPRNAGESCRPVGRNGSRAVKKLMQEAGLPPWLRDQWPVLALGDLVVAIPNVCICEGDWVTRSGVAPEWKPL